MLQRLKNNKMTHAYTEHLMPSENSSFQSQSSDLSSSTTVSNLYHESMCGSILLPLPVNSPMEIFAHLRHARFDQFQCCFNVYHNEIIHMRNEHGQTVLHILAIHAYPYQWIRLLLMRKCDPCAQDHDGYTPVHYAIERDDVEMLKALTARFYSAIKLFSEERINEMHNTCLKALSIREKHGLTGFMLACHRQSIKCLDYLLELQINDVNLQDIHGDTCLHYAVACRNEILVNKLIDQCHANVNSGNQTRPSVLDILQFNRESQKSFDRKTDDSIEQILLSRQAINRCQIRRITNKRKESSDIDESVVVNLASLNVDSQIRTARNYAQLALASENLGDMSSAEEYYQRAMNSVPNDTLDWTDYAFKIAILHMTRGENSLALGLLQQALIIRNQFEKETDDIRKIQGTIDYIRSHVSI